MSAALEGDAAPWQREQHPGPAERRTEPPQHEAEDLTGGGREALIRFRDQVYTLRITRQGKLLLTK